MGLARYAPQEEPGNVRFPCCKDGRSVKLGSGPGGPPVLETDKLLELIRTLTSMKCLDAKAVQEAAKS